VPKILSEANIEAFRDRLCHVAEGLFAAHGPDGVTMRELAEALGVSQMTPYRYFKDKDTILAAVRTRAFDRFSAAMEAADRKVQVRHRKPTRAAKGTADRGGDNAYLEFALGNPAAYRLMFDVSQPTFSEYPELLAAMDRARRTMGEGLRQLAADGRFNGDVALTAHVFWAMLHGAVMLELVGFLQAEKFGARKIAKTALEALGRQFGLQESTVPRRPGANGSRR
jgi:AcrR family transcriptional regulator